MAFDFHWPLYAAPNYRCIDWQSRESCQDALTAMIGNVKSNTSNIKNVGRGTLKRTLST